MRKDVESALTERVGRFDAGKTLHPWIPYDITAIAVKCENPVNTTTNQPLEQSTHLRIGLKQLLGSQRKRSFEHATIGIRLMIRVVDCVDKVAQFRRNGLRI